MTDRMQLRVAVTAISVINECVIRRHEPAARYRLSARRHTDDSVGDPWNSPTLSHRKSACLFPFQCHRRIANGCTSAACTS
jgi:hypothetical protein